jgi:ribosomal protein S18 acetylase RimI-like enzyme
MPKNNEAVFGPLQLKGEFSYNINKTYIGQEQHLFDYVNSIAVEHNIKINVKALFDKSIFTRIIQLDLGHSSPVIGLLTVKIFNGSYNITHISVHKSFRRQGLGKLLLMSFANHLLGVEPGLNMVTVIIPDELNDALMFFRTLKFNEMRLVNNNHMLKSTNLFLEIVNSPLIGH